MMMIGGSFCFKKTGSIFVISSIETLTTIY